MKTQNNLTAGKFLTIVNISDKKEMERVGKLEYAYTHNFDNGTFMVFNQEKTETQPYCQFAVSITEILKVA